MNVPEQFVIEKFYQFAGYPRFKKISNTYEAGCPICKEGSSWGRKRRLYYIPKDEILCCHNCGWYGNPIKWIMEVEGISYRELAQQLETSDSAIVDVSTMFKHTEQVYDVPDLPVDSIDLLNGQQTEYYRDSKIVQQAIQYIKDRKIDTAVNRPAHVYLSLVDKVHKNRICFPSCAKSGKVTHYQTRSFLPNDDRPKYLSKLRSERDIYGINNVSDIYPYMYIFEGPVDSFFVENGVAIYGIQENSKTCLTASQYNTLNSMFYIQKTWVLDNQRKDTTSLKNTKRLLEQGERVFIWPESLSQFKDFNEMSMHFNLDEISNKLIDDNTHQLTSAVVK